jgi:hypothetical protein
VSSFPARSGAVPMLPTPRPVSTRRQDVQQALTSAIRTLPIPGERPSYAHPDEATGLAFFELSLRMDHVRRVSENLALVDSTHMRREVSIDLDLRQITSRQRRALSIRPLGPMVNRTVRPVQTPEDSRGRFPDLGSVPDQGVGRLIWVPIARQSRGDLTAVDVRDGQDYVVMRMSTHATQRALTSGLTRLVKTRLSAGRQGAPPDRTDLGLLSRWLFEHAIAKCIESGLGHVPDVEASDQSGPGGPVREPRGQSTSLAPVGLSWQEIRQVRARAQGLLDELRPQERSEFLELLAMAAGEQLLVVLLPVDPSQVHLHYVASPMPTDPRTTLWGRRLRSFLPVNREYTVEYETQLPRSIRSYHVSLAVPEEIKVRRCLLSSDLDASRVAGLLTDLVRLSDALTPSSASRRPEMPSPVWEQGLSEVLTQVATLARVRESGLKRYRDYLTRALAQYGGRLPATTTSPARSDPVEAFVLNKGSLSDLLLLARRHEQGLLLEDLLTREVERIKDFLTGLADFLSRYDLSYDVATDSDPRDNGANVRWHPQPLRGGPRLSEPIRVGLFVALADEPPALVESVARMILGLMAMVSFIAAPTLLSRHLPHFPSGLGSHGNDNGNDALVAVLLLIPGILLARLDIPNTHSILGELRAFPRRIAYASVIVTSSLALIAAADITRLGDWSTYTTALLAGFFGLCVLELIARGLRRRSLVPRSKLSPGWLVQAVTGNGRPRNWYAPIDAGFQAIGEPGLPDPESRLAIRRNQLIVFVNRYSDRLWDWFFIHRRNRSAQESVAVPYCGDIPCEDKLRSAQPASVVARAARVAAERTTAVRFEVAHLPGHGSTFSELGGHGPMDDCWQMVEMLGFCAYGNAVEIRTRPINDAAAVFGGPVPVVEASSPPDEFGVLRVKGRYSPDFLRTGAGHDVEILLSLGDGWDLCTAQAQMTTKILHDVFAMMDEADAVPAFVVLPATSPADVDTTQNPLETRTELCLRIGVLNGPAPEIFGDAGSVGTAGRFEFENMLLEYARELGLGAWIGQGRANSHPGQWRRIRSHDAARYREHRRRCFPELAEDDRPVRLRQVSFVLPCGPVVSSSLHDLAARLRTDGIGTRSLIAWPLHQAMFVNMLVPVLAETPPERTPGNYDELRQACGHTWRRSGTPDPVLDERLVLVTETEHPVRPAEPGLRTATFWVTWDVPERGDVDAITAHLVSTFREHVPHGEAWLVMLRARHNDRDHLRGRAKVIVQVPEDWQSWQLGALAHRVQHDVRLETEKAFPWRNTAVALTVTWGERYLGK